MFGAERTVVLILRSITQRVAVAELFVRWLLSSTYPIIVDIISRKGETQSRSFMLLPVAPVV